MDKEFTDLMSKMEKRVGEFWHACDVFEEHMAEDRETIRANLEGWLKANANRITAAIRLGEAANKFAKAVVKAGGRRFVEMSVELDEQLESLRGEDFRKRQVELVRRSAEA